MERKINVALFVDNFAVIDGVVMVIRQYAKRLHGRANVYVVCPRSSRNELSETYTIVPCPSIRVPILNYDVAVPFGRQRFIKRMRSLDIDLVHVHSPFMVGSLGLKVAQALDVPCVATLHSQYKQDFEIYLKSKTVAKTALKGIMKLYNASTESWVVNTKVEELLCSYGYEGTTHIIPNATDDTPIEDVEAAKAEVNEKLGFRPEDKVLMYLGRITGQKNVFFTEKVLCALKDRGFDFKFIFVGGGTALNSLKETVRNDGLWNNVVFTGSCTDRDYIKKLYARSDLFVFPSYYDTDGIVKYEAAAQGTPTVFAEGTLALAGIEDGVNGYVGPNDAEAFADKIIDIFSDEARHERVSENVKTALYRTWDKTVDAVYERYNYLIDQNKAKKQQN